MDYLALQQVTLGAAALAAFVGIVQARNARGGFRSRSAKTYTAAAVVLALSILVGVIFKSEQTVLIGETVAFLLLAGGLLVQGKEGEVFEKIAAEQRTDYVSGLPNARALQERLAAEHSRTKRTGMRYAIAVFEIDGYHTLEPEDKVNGMRLLANSMDESVRNTDSVGRLSNEHVAVMMVDTAADGGIVGCERARERFFFMSCAHDADAHVTRPMTVSVGIAAFDEDTIDPNDVIDNAKLALQRVRAEEGVGLRLFERADFTRRHDSASAQL
jgi:diguanylate cyclase (GGDEF)-like protein